MNSATIAKLAQALKSRRLTRALLHERVLAGAEHRYVLSRNLATVVDVGANRGQFALAVRRWAPKARVISFEPLPGPASIYRRIFLNDSQVALHQAALGLCAEQRQMHISERDDSSSLLPISSVQTSVFPGTAEVAAIEVRVGPLSEFLPADEVNPPALLKLDVQGFEYEALLGCQSMLSKFAWVYCECSFMELYTGQELAPEIIALLGRNNFRLAGIYNPLYDKAGSCIQADMLFSSAAE
jgi:FkbM family methyltransferase